MSTTTVTIQEFHDDDLFILCAEDLDEEDLNDLREKFQQLIDKKDEENTVLSVNFDVKIIILRRESSEGF